MKSQRILILLAIFITGCGRKNTPAPQSAPPDTPATEMAAPAPTTQSTESVLTIDGRPTKFPSAILNISPADKGLWAHLYCGDSFTVSPTGDLPNGYALDMSLTDTDDPADLSRAVWAYKSPFTERRDSPFGIFLPAQQKLLQPKEIQVHFTGTMPQITVILHGAFMQFDTSDAAAPSREVIVDGALVANVITNNNN